MKHQVFIGLIFMLFGLSSHGQAGISDYLVVVVDFTENQKPLEAVKLCDKLAESYPENPDIYFLRGVNQYVLKEYDRAIRDFDKTLQLKPDYPDAHLYRAKARKANKDYLGAVSDYNKAKDQNFAQTLTSLAGDMVRSLFSGKD